MNNSMNHTGNETFWKPIGEMPEVRTDDFSLAVCGGPIGPCGWAEGIFWVSRKSKIIEDGFTHWLPVLYQPSEAREVLLKYLLAEIERESVGLYP